jgi:hypothetical protein
MRGGEVEEMQQLGRPAYPALLKSEEQQGGKDKFIHYVPGIVPIINSEIS